MVKIDDSNKIYKLCIESIKERLSNMGELTGQPEALHSLYVDTILVKSVSIVKEITGKSIRMYPQMEIIGVEASGNVDYAIRTSKISGNLEELVCITETKKETAVIGIIQNIMQLKSAFYSNKKNKSQKTDRDFEDYYDYIYGIVTTGEFCQGIIIYINIYLTNFNF
jgi:hypothetical protein